MQRHFTSRSEALSEVTATRMLAHRKLSAESAPAVQGGRPAKSCYWFKAPEKSPHSRKNVNPPKHNGQDSLIF